MLADWRLVMATRFVCLAFCIYSSVIVTRQSVTAFVALIGRLTHYELTVGCALGQILFIDIR